MDETIALILEGCNMAKFLETNLPNMANRPELLLSSCEEIIRVFSRAKENVTKAQLIISEPNHEYSLLAQQHRGVAGMEQMGGRAAQPPTGSESEVELNVEAASSGTGMGSPSQRQRRRRNGADRRVERVAAPQMGNTEVPPEDGYAWKKYGQKDILNSKFPRSYFRCTHQKPFQCPAKKQVQRLDSDSNIFQVTYKGDHTCRLSSTAAPSLPVPPSLELRHDIIHQQGTAAVHPLPTWTTTVEDVGMQIPGGYGIAGPSGDHVDCQLPVADMADAMFNSGSSSNNSMELIFSSMDDKWDSDDKKI